MKMNPLFYSRMKWLFTGILLLPLSIFACGKKGWKTTESGIQYKVFPSGDTSPRPVFGDYIWMHLRKLSPNRKELFNTRVFNATQGVEMEYKASPYKVDVTEVFAYMQKGDSAQVRIPSHLLDSSGARNKYYYYELLLLDVRGKSDYQREKEVQIQQQQTLDSLAILAYLQKNDIRASAVDDQGLWYSRRSFGAGENVQAGDTVTLHYIGKLTNEVEFDNSYERNQPFTFVVGTKQVIEGLDKGIRHFFYGDTGMLIIPSRWAYGSRETGRIPANAVLVFEFQIMEKNP